MNIAFITSEYPHKKLHRSAGLGSSIKNLGKQLVDKGFKVTVFVAFQKENDQFNDGGMRIVSIKRAGFLFGPVSGRGRPPVALPERIRSVPAAPALPA